ncbi:MAG: hypothetical protein A3B10_04510 [Candidatus Doudnabacteria bacterium RIFCSPLOWO2_01_FULL_44_21]|uniref:Regulatory protein RecX n=1 Tax=Candidatus Doudnabacteria bacterium RIFCSPLOWO2_01_FULL_44_21 TaxID=1817841 RepID=A0A1F5PXV7_9BACT|nr:MAG: hypothetical protein A3B95_01485 [Candidatus Doudnabacteria bacterium RIFCSPHIGHO2_02_FULL_43_13b]OGE94743.1 MAG: hypothetical protein A3B10_04510 [Candidatus Doudnabacteria bacterium RIFCSPLOWO2_01_FULL_44_21]
MEMENYQKALEKAHRLLKIRPHTRIELIRKLTLKGYNAQLVEKVTQELLEQNLINDELFAQIYLDNLIRYKTFGFYGLKAKLMQRGIPAGEAETLLKEKLPIEAETEIAMRIVDRNSGLEKNKLAQKLARKGFRSEVIREVLKL